MLSNVLADFFVCLGFNEVTTPQVQTTQQLLVLPLNVLASAIIVLPCRRGPSGSKLMQADRGRYCCSV